ncbi:arrestin domain-containing protein 2-like [Phlebotomus argentipes]|uniref:arrestin domain-containing protein 2-like n=1 Tax=Phlebotomus argentipes TaxID=94469 RepID=UPI0028933D9F|nr:arrestin domain-containing protein 2-like [Phlebotomus argentipes]
MTTTNIIFDKDTYVAGENVTGRVEIFNSSPMNIRHISLMIKGSAEVHWTEQESYTENNEQKSRTITFSSHEQYLNSQTVLYGQHGGPTIQLPPGQHSYNFACSLPPSLPGSIFGAHGKIEYIAKVNIDIPWALDDKFSRSFRVVPSLDLNHDPQLRLPVESERVKNYCSWKCSTSPAIITVKLPQTGFITGDNIPVSVHISNLSSVTIQGVQVKLMQRCEFFATTPRHKSKSNETKIDYKRFELIQQKDERDIELQTDIRVPFTEVSCKLAAHIKVFYHLEVAIYVLGCHNTTRMYVPITIGTFPLRPEGENNTFLPQVAFPNAPPQIDMPIVPPMLPGSSPAPLAPYPPAMPVPMPNAPLAPSAPSAATPDETAPPPSYADVMFGWKSDEKTYNSPSAPALPK